MAEAKDAKRKFFVGGNWKCNGTVKSVTELCEGLAKITTEGVMHAQFSFVFKIQHIQISECMK